jgi:tetratricopeptide (TPR) repeat protein
MAPWHSSSRVRVQPITASSATKRRWLPLAIEMAAARVGTFGAAALAELMTQHHQVLGRGGKHRPPRQRTLEALYGWSYQLLGECGKAAFRRIAVFPGAFDLVAAETVVGWDSIPVERVAESIALLVDHSLLTAVHGSPPMWRLHPTAREAATSLMRAAGEAIETSERHLQFLVHLYESHFERWFVMPDTEWRDHTDRLQDDLRVALTWSTGASGNAASAATLLGASLPDWQWRDFQAYYEGWRWCALVKGQSPSISEPRSAARWHYLDSVLMPLDAGARRPLLEEAEREAAIAGDIELQVQIRMDLAEHALAMRALEDASEILESVAPIVFGLPRGRLQGYHHFLAGQVAHSLGESLLARESYQSAQRQLSEVGAQCLALHSELHVGRNLWDLQRLEQALESLDRLAAESAVSRFGDDHVTGFALLFSAGVCIELGRVADAVERILAALRPLRRTRYSMAGLHIISAGLALIGEELEAEYLVNWSATRRVLTESMAGPGIERVKALRDAAIASVASSGQTLRTGRAEVNEEAMLSTVSAAFSHFRKVHPSAIDDE